MGRRHGKPRAVHYRIGDYGQGFKALCGRESPQCEHASTTEINAVSCKACRDVLEAQKGITGSTAVCIYDLPGLYKFIDLSGQKFQLLSLRFQSNRFPDVDAIEEDGAGLVNKWFFYPSALSPWERLYTVRSMRSPSGKRLRIRFTRERSEVRLQLRWKGGILTSVNPACTPEELIGMMGSLCKDRVIEMDALESIIYEHGFRRLDRNEK